MFIVLRYLKKALYLLKSSSGKKEKIFSGKDGIAVYQASSSKWQLTKKYIEKIEQKEITLHVSKDTLNATINFTVILQCIAILFFLFVIIFPASIIKKKKSGIYALIILEYVELVLLLKLLQKHKIKKLYVFDTIEKDADLTALALKKIGIEVYKMPEGSLENYFRRLISDVFCLSTYYQMEEYLQIQDKYDWHINRIQIVPPFNICIEDNISFFNKSCEADSTGIIGLLSGGVWRRKERGDYYNNDGFFESEAILMNLLKFFFIQYPGYRLFIYFHPCETEDENIYERGSKYYRNYFKGIDIIFADLHASTRQQFHRSDVAITVYSNSGFERLYCGYKTLFTPFNIPFFPMKNTKAQNITIKDTARFSEILKETLHTDTDLFFKKKEMENYRYDHWAKLSAGKTTIA